MSRAPYSPSTEPPAPKGQQASALTFNRALRKRRAACDRLQAARLLLFGRKPYPRFSAQSGMRFPPEPPRGNCVPFWTPILGRAFRNGPLAESASHSERLFWDAVSQRALFRKACPILSLQTGMHFPVEVQSGKRVPFRGCLSNWNAASASASAICRRPRLLLVRRAPACGGGIRARRAWRAQGDGARAG